MTSIFFFRITFAPNSAELYLKCMGRGTPGDTGKAVHQLHSSLLIEQCSNGLVLSSLDQKSQVVRLVRDWNKTEWKCNAEFSGKFRCCSEPMKTELFQDFCTQLSFSFEVMTVAYKKSLKKNVSVAQLL